MRERVERDVEVSAAVKAGGTTMGVLTPTKGPACAVSTRHVITYLRTLLLRELALLGLFDPLVELLICDT